MNRIIALSAVLSLSLTPAANALSGLQAYWDMDATTLSGKLPANDGHQAATLTESSVFFDFGFASENLTPTGTDINIVGDAPINNYGVGFTDPTSVGLLFSFRADNFDFSDLQDVVMTFAIENYTLAIADDFKVEARIGDGTWTDYAESVTGSNTYQLATVSFGSDLNNISSPVDLRIRYEAVGEFISYLNIDNVQVNAVPEPEAYGLLLGAVLLGVVVTRRRFRKTA